LAGPVPVWHRPVDFLVDNGITAGCQLAPPLYCGAQPVTRGEMAVFLKKLADLFCMRREGNDVIFEGCNVHVRSGAGATDALSRSRSPSACPA
jgi:hypothetical protein